MSTITQPDPSAHYGSAHYWQTMTHLQKGEWEEALRGLEQLLVHNPEDQRLRKALEETRYKARLDSESRIRTRRWLFPYQQWIDRIVIGMGVFVVLWMGAAFAYQQAQRKTVEAEQAALHQSWLAEADLFLNADDLANAEQRLNRILADAPTDTNALVKLAQVKQEREILYRYQEAVSKQGAGDCTVATRIFSELQSLRSNYRDVAARLWQCKQQQQIAQLLSDASTFERTGQLNDAIQAYQTSRQLGVQSLSDGTVLAVRLATLYVQAGKAVLTQSTLSSQQLTQAQSDFANAIEVDPQNPEAISQAQLLNRYLLGRNAVASQDWAAAVSNLRTVYETEADYLSGTAVNLLYNAYIGLGDGYRAGGDCTLALQRYSSAAALPVSDTSLARARSNLSDCGSAPSAVVEIQPTTESTPITNPPITNSITSEVPTPIPPSPPPPISLSALHNRLIFKSSNQAQPGFWAMDGDGNNRQFLGGLEDANLSGQYNGLLNAYRISPDGEFQVFVGEVYEKSQVFIGRIDKAWPDRPLTSLTGIAYDPQWSPVGGAVLFVSQEDGSDDIWFIGADGQSQHSLVRNTWEWDKSPTWSPNGSQIAFWSNRTGLKQIFVMNADGKEVHNISNTGWDESEPLWVR